jgi:putative tryptophan/tyrosine transport system substrate-binding protein
MRRRDLIKGLAAVGWPLAAHAQQPVDRIRRIGVLIPFAESDAEAQTQVIAFREQLQRLGWTDGRNVRIDYRWAVGAVGLIRTFAKELVELQPDVILARATSATAALLQETRTIPIVFVVVSDPIGDGFVGSMARPGGNVTGFTNVEASLGGKWLELLKEIAPRISRVAVMFGLKTAAGGGVYYLRLVEDAAASIGVRVVAIPVQDGAEIERAIEAFTRRSLDCDTGPHHHTSSGGDHRGGSPTPAACDLSVSIRSCRRRLGFLRSRRCGPVSAGRYLRGSHS